MSAGNKVPPEVRAAPSDLPQKCAKNGSVLVTTRKIKKSRCGYFFFANTYIHTYGKHQTYLSALHTDLFPTPKILRTFTGENLAFNHICTGRELSHNVSYV